MKTKPLSPIEFVPGDEIFDAVVEMAEELGVPVLTEQYYLYDTVLGEMIKVLSATDGWEEERWISEKHLVKSLLSQTRLGKFTWRCISFFTGRQPPKPRHTRESMDERLEQAAFYRSLRDVPKEELCQAVEKLAAVLTVPIRTEHYDLVVAFYDEKEKDRKAHENLR